MSERSWQDIMIEQFGADWLKPDYSIKEIGKIAELAFTLESQLASEREKVGKLRSTIEDLLAESDHAPNCDVFAFGSEDSFCSCMDRNYFNIPAIKERSLKVLKEIEG